MVVITANSNKSKRILTNSTSSNSLGMNQGYLIESSHRSTYLIPRSMCAPERQFIFVNHQPTFKELHCLVTHDCNIAHNLLIPRSMCAPERQFIFVNHQPTFKELHCLVTPDCNIAHNLFITPDSKGPHSVSCCQQKQNNVFTTLTQFFS
ncbi:hypothetical protein Fot_21656 [Forsythia ovata]|uniref:Uncharacterized protein n=1 Tax=Forsythia ovata TaxID=205694 RepID=A0ABD1UX14_9LAMI